MEAAVILKSISISYNIVFHAFVAIDHVIMANLMVNVLDREVVGYILSTVDNIQK